MISLARTLLDPDPLAEDLGGPVTPRPLPDDIPGSALPWQLEWEPTDTADRTEALRVLGEVRRG